ncbi:MAG: ACP S-malonyltransferase, partial [Planctomycetales bacterium]|nr:ACP S-malonyltransferase [Planctomycetales bacterium]
GAFSLEDGLRLVRRRGELMQAACDAAPSGMASLLGADLATAEAVCRDAAAGGVLVVANVNAPDQVAISGDREAVGRALEAAKARGVKRAIPLKVAGAFHSPLMKPAAEGLSGAVAEAAISKPRFPVVSNAWARAVSDPAEIRRALVEQLTAPVRWVEGVRALAALGARRFLELGPGKVCAGLVKRIVPEAETLSVGATADLDAAIGFIG